MAFRRFERIDKNRISSNESENVIEFDFIMPKTYNAIDACFPYYPQHYSL